ncbi:Spy/CpxP family protein refolding chaperone [Dysgonomonadaceae bacterium PH5-43]|nr:Spy/CpxP family protein refolding chaperone [Dysgonomonadaceae bacterium PH5-43]
MKALLKSSIVCMLITVFTLSASAQQRERRAIEPEKFATEQTEVMTKDLDLNEEQQVKVKAIYKEYAEELKALRDANNTDREAARAKMTAANEKKDKAIKEVLTPEQIKKLEALEKAKREARTKRQGQGERPARRN